MRSQSRPSRHSFLILSISTTPKVSARAGTPFVELVAVMSKYNPFAEKAGMQKIVEQPPAKEALAIATVLSELGLNIQLLGSEKYFLDKLRTLKLEDVARIKDAFVRNKAPRFMKYFFSHEPYGKEKLFARNS